MKKTALILFVSLGLILSGCNKDDDDNPAPVNNTDLLPGSWKVTYFFDDEDETSDYADYTFEFTATGDLNAITSSQTFAGSWQETIDDNLPRLVITLAGNEDLVELSDDWVIVSISSSEINLRDDNTTSNEELRFTKIN